MDVAKINRGDWKVIELGDAQAAELPPDTDQAAFFRTLSRQKLTTEV